MSVISEEKQKEFISHLNWFFKNSLITDEEKYALIDRMEKQVEERIAKITNTTNKQFYKTEECMNFEKAKNLRVVFDNTMDITRESVGFPFLYKNNPIGVISAVYEDRIECLIFDRFMKCYSEYIRKDSDLKLTAINMYLE